MTQRPVAIGLLICENVIIEKGTGNVTPVNCFIQRSFKEFPAPLSCTVLGFLTDGIGQIELGLRVQRMDNMDEILAQDASIRFGSPLEEIRFTYRVKNLVVENAGPLLVTLLADNEIVAQRKLRVNLRRSAK